MKAFEDCKELKNAAIHTASLYRAANSYCAYGEYWNGEKGNVSGCMYHNYLTPGQPVQEAMLYPESVHGIPRTVAVLIDAFFAGLSVHSDKTLYQGWAEKVYIAIPTGADLTGVPDQLALYILESPEWLTGYASEQGKYVADVMTGIFKMRYVHQINQKHRLDQTFKKHFYDLGRAATEGHRNIEAYAMAAMEALCMVEMQADGPWSHFIKDAVKGSAQHMSSEVGVRTKKLSEIFLQLLKDA